MGTIVWNGITSRSISLIVERPPDYVVAERDYEATHILGRNGDLLTDNKSFKNVQQPYDIAFGSLEKTHSEMAAAVSEWLHSASGYARLEDSYDLDHFRMAYYMEETELENILNHLGRATINFNCMPYRFLKSGDRPVMFTTTGQILLNPTRFEALPLITVYGTGAATLTVNDMTIKIKEIGNQITLDSDLGEAYMISSSGIATSKNDQIEWADAIHHAFPFFHSGQNRIAFTGSVTKVEVTPRWWIV